MKILRAVGALSRAAIGKARASGIPLFRCESPIKSRKRRELCLVALRDLGQWT